MNNYNPNIHNRKSIRLKGYDYTQAGLNFITICVKDRECLFGEIYVTEVFGVEQFQPQQEMRLSVAGKIADECWLEIPKHFPNAVLHEHIIMPNHVHGIIELKCNDVGASYVMSLGTSHVMSQQNQFSKPIAGSISVIIQQYKSSVSRLVKKNNMPHFIWQSRFYEHIIRDEQSYENIADYILNNPKNWKNDDLHKNRGAKLKNE